MVLTINDICNHNKYNWFLLDSKSAFMSFGTIWRRGAQLLHEEELGLARNVASSTLMTCASSGSVVVARGKKDPRLKPAGRDQDVVVATPPARKNLRLII